MGTITGTEAGVVKFWSRRAEFRAAEKDDEGMALKIRTRTEGKLDVMTTKMKFYIYHEF